MPLNLTSFSKKLASYAGLSQEKSIAVALSGGGDSMALAYLLSRWASKRNITLHLLTVDHGLRPGSKAEAAQVASWVKNWPAAIHKILSWRGEKPKSRIQEAARQERYRLMADYCARHKIRYLFLAHHADDQAETFFFRLAKGSGLDGLAGMKKLQEYDNCLVLVRPCLNYNHDNLLAVCKRAKISWVEDPSNDTDRFARIRLRKAKDVLAREGLTSERILTLMARLQRIRKALDEVTEKSAKTCEVKNEPSRIELDYKALILLPEEIILRLLQKSITAIAGPRIYPPKMQNLELIVTDLLHKSDFKSSTLAGCLIKLQRRSGILIIEKESLKRPAKAFAGAGVQHRKDD